MRNSTEIIDLAKKYGIRSIVFPAISTGKFSYPRKEACEIAVKSVYTWLKENSDYDMKVVFSCVDPKIYELIYPTPEPRILPSSIGGEMNWRFPAFSAVDLVELR